MENSNVVFINKWIFYMLSGTSFLGLFMLATIWLMIEGVIKIG